MRGKSSFQIHGFLLRSGIIPPCALGFEVLLRANYVAIGTGEVFGGRVSVR